LVANLRLRLLWPVLVAVVPTLAVVVLSVREQRRLLTVQAQGDVQAVAEVVAERHQRSVDLARGVLVAMTQMRHVAGLDGPTCSRVLGPLLTREPSFINVGATRADGLVYCSAVPVTAAVNLSDRAFFREALRTRGFGVGEYVVSRIRGAGALGFGLPVTGDDDRVVAVAFASLATERLQGELDDLALPTGAWVAVLDRAGATLSARPASVAVAGERFDEGVSRAVLGAGAPVTLTGADGVARVWAARDVTSPDGTVAMRVLAGLPLGAVLDPVNRVWGRAMALAAVAFVLAMTAAYLVAELSLARRLRRLEEVTRGIAAGDWSARSGVPRHGDEIAQLAGHLDDMGAALAELDAAKRQREDQLRQAQRFEAVGQVAGGVAHDFNNLLTVILSAGGSLRDRLASDATAREEAREIVYAAERAAALTRQLLAFSRRQPLAPRTFDLGEAASGMQRLLRRLLGEGIALTVTVRARAPVHADPSQIEMALLNLAVNARDAMPEGGRLEVLVDAVAADAEGRPEGTPPGPLALLRVRDTGVGMDAATRARVFEPFFTTKAPGRGTGLGLPIVLGVVSECGGTIQLDSAPGEGTEFRIFLPLRAAGAERAGAGAGTDGPRGSETVLVVEDDPHVRFVARRTLESHGYTVLEAEAAAEALAIARARPGAPDLVLCDVVLPDGNGVDLGRALEARWPGVAVLFTSGYAGERLGSLGALPAARLLPKPFTAETMLRRVREALDATPRPTAAGT
jgi:signal transduction histidine kinase/ActR/RegA family two-component response regulator